MGYIIYYILHLGLILIKGQLILTGQILQLVLTPVSSCSCKKFNCFSRGAQASEWSLFTISTEVFSTPPCCFTQNATSYVVCMVYQGTLISRPCPGFCEYYITGTKLRMQCFHKQYLIIKKCQCKHALPKAKWPLLSFSHMMLNLHEDLNN